MTTYRLASAPMLYAPGMIAWAQNGYAFKNDQPVILNVIQSAWPTVPEHALKDLLAKRVPHKIVEPEIVEFSV